VRSLGRFPGPETCPAESNLELNAAFQVVYTDCTTVPVLPDKHLFLIFLEGSKTVRATEIDWKFCFGFWGAAPVLTSLESQDINQVQTFAAKPHTATYAVGGTLIVIVPWKSDAHELKT
jgi:hypothetical protein